MTELDTRAERVRQIAEQLYGNILDRDGDGDVMWCEIPADLCGAFTSMIGMNGLTPILKSQTTRPAHRRVVTTQGDTVVCSDQPMILMAYYRYTVDLQPHRVAVSHDPHADAAAITRPTPPFKG